MSQVIQQIFLVAAIGTPFSAFAVTEFYVHPNHNRCIGLWGNMSRLNIELLDTGVDRTRHAHVSRVRINPVVSPASSLPMYRFENSNEESQRGKQRRHEVSVAMTANDNVGSPARIQSIISAIGVANWRLPNTIESSILLESEVFCRELTNLWLNGKQYILIWNATPDGERAIKISAIERDEAGDTKIIFDMKPLRASPGLWITSYVESLEENPELERQVHMIIQNAGIKPFFIMSSDDDHFYFN